jgi:hypothetical protein
MTRIQQIADCVSYMTRIHEIGDTCYITVHICYKFVGETHTVGLGKVDSIEFVSNYEYGLKGGAVSC